MSLFAKFPFKVSWSFNLTNANAKVSENHIVCRNFYSKIPDLNTMTWSCLTSYCNVRILDLEWFF